jgi:magnesium transporter
MNNLKVVTHKKIGWYKLFKPTEKQLKELQKKYNFHPLDIEDCLEPVQRPKIDIYRSYVFLVLHLPKWSPKTQNLGRAELNVFLGPDFLITIHSRKIPTLDSLFYKARQEHRKRKRFFRNSSYYLFYFIFNQLLININPITRQLNQILKQLDDEILQGNYRKVLERITLMRRNLVLFETVIKPQIPVIRKLEQGKAKIVSPTYAYYWGNLLDRLKSIKEEVEDMLQLLEGLSTTSESLLTNRTNQIIKLLTVFSVVLMPLNLIAGIYGMNLNLPLAQNFNAFWILMSLMLSLSLIMIMYFKIRKWI